MGAAIGLIWKDQCDRVRPFAVLGIVGLLKFSEVVVIYYSYIANAFIDRLYLCTIVALWPAGQILVNTFSPTFRLVFAGCIDKGCDQCAIIYVTARSRANPSLPLWIGKVLVRFDAFCVTGRF